jgi:uncharacterized protein Usg
MINTHKSVFSESSIWQLQVDYFMQSGINAWKNNEVPHYITSNPVVAKVYAELVYAFLCDLAKTYQGKEKIYLLELGAGHGRFCYHFLKHLDLLTAGTDYALPDFCYVLSDFSEKDIHYWKKHPRLQPFYKKGQLDHCLFNAQETQEIKLELSGKTLNKASLGLPLILIANYFFDTLPQDLFFIENHTLHACYTETILPGNIANKTAKDLITEIIIRETDKSLLHTMPYPETFFNRILEQYLDQLETGTYLLFPHIGLRCINRLSELSTHGVMLLTADRGYHRLSELENRPFPIMSIHGCFSYSVNYHAFKTYCTMKGGVDFFPNHRHDSIVHGCLLLMTNPEHFAETKLAYQRFVKDFNPDDFYTLKKLFVSASNSFSLQELLASLRLSGYDARFFNQLLPRLTDLIGSADEQERWDIFQVIHQVWEMYYPLGEENDLAFQLGVLLIGLNFAKEALSYFNLSAKLYEYAINRSYNIALCHYMLTDYAMSLQMARDNYKTAPDHPQNNELLKHLEILTANHAKVV